MTSKVSLFFYPPDSDNSPDNQKFLHLFPGKIISLYRTDSGSGNRFAGYHVRKTERSDFSLTSLKFQSFHDNDIIHNELKLGLNG